MSYSIKITSLAVLMTALLLGAVWSVFTIAKPQLLEAATVAELTGWAWSENVGWFSVNCATGGDSGGNICGTSNYSIDIDGATKELSGYAWSDNIGWIRFDNLLGCPDGTCDARVISNGTADGGWELTGWARACSVFEVGCSGTVKPIDGDELGGWDGWISLNCKNDGNCATSNYAIRISKTGSVASNAGPTGSFAWGDMNLGWIDFGSTALSSSCSYDVVNSCTDTYTSHKEVTNIWCEVTPTDTDCSATGQFCSATTGVCAAIPVVDNFTITPSLVRSGDTVTADWSVSNIDPAATCEVTGGGVTQTGGISDSATFTPTNQTTYTLSCDGVELETVTVKVLPSVYES